MYKDFGYNNAIDKDRDSLSYLAEPISGLWLLALDSCRWKENKQGAEPITGGLLSNKTLKWIEDILIRSKILNKRVIAMMHHGVLEHYRSNKDNYPDYIVEDYDEIADMFSSYNLSLVFTGHFHAQDITVKRYKSPYRFLFDIETGSILTFPCPYRVIKINRNQIAEIKSYVINSIEPYKDDFQVYAERFLYEGTIIKAQKKLKAYKVRESDREIISHEIAIAYLTHLKGDEAGLPLMIDYGQLSMSSKIIVFWRSDLIKGWKTDLEPLDNNIKINLINGDIVKKKKPRSSLQPMSPLGH